MSISLSFFEERISQFMDRILEKKYTTKSDLIKVWNSMDENVEKRDKMEDKIDDKRIDDKKIDDKKKEKVEEKVATEYSADKCTFVITRGEKMGERCSSRVKKDTLFCVKHTKDKKDDVKDVSEIKKDDVRKEVNEIEFMTSSHRMEIEMRKKSKQIKPLSLEKVDEYTVIKGTPIVLNDSNDVIGYLHGKTFIKGITPDFDKIIQSYNLTINRNGWSEIDE